MMSKLQGAPSWRADLTSGFLVFLIALPLSLGIALASNFPPIAGIMTAVIGGVVATWLGSAHMTIKGPAAGLIVIALGSVTELGGGDMMLGYQRTLAVGVIAASIQIGLAFVRAGRLGEIFPPSVVHGMLGAIGVIIVSKQIHTMVGVKPHGHEPIELLAEVPNSLAKLNPEIALIGALSLLILFGIPRLPWKAARRIPGPMVVLAAMIPLGLWFDLSHEHTYTFAEHVYPVGPQYLVQISGDFIGAITLPDFGAITSAASVKYIILFALIGSVESLLSAKAVDILDPQKRKSDMNRDLLAVGVGNLVASMVGGLPMISEIVRSKANIDNGGRTRLANFFHGVFLFAFVALLPGLLSNIPLAALGAMLVYTGLRLASPSEFRHTWAVGREQFFIFVTTLVVTLATDLLIGVGVGIALKLLIHLIWHGVTPGSLFRADIVQEGAADERRIVVSGAAVFSNYLALHAALMGAKDAGARIVTLDFGASPFVDHTTMERLHDVAHEFEAAGLELHIIGMERLAPVSSHPMAARKLASAQPRT